MGTPLISDDLHISIVSPALNSLVSLCRLLTSTLVLTLVLFSSSVFGAESSGDVQLRGIFKCENQTYALLQIVENLPGGRGTYQYSTILRLDARSRTLVGPGREPAYTLLEVDEKEGSIRLRKGNQEEVLTITDAAADKLPNRTLHLRDAPISLVLEVYQTISGRTVLATYNWPQTPINLKSGASLSAKEVIQLLEKTLVAEGLAAKRLGRKAVAILPAKNLPSLDKMPPVPASMAGGEDELVIASPAKPLPPNAANDEVLPPGMLKFMQADLLQALDVYQELCGRTILSPDLPPCKISIRTQSALTRAEAIWLLDALFYMHGLAMVREGEKWVYSVPLASAVNLPHYDPATILAKFKNPPAQDAKPATLKLDNASCEQLLTLYASLLGREPLPVPANMPRLRSHLRSQTALTPQEAIFTLEAFARLQQLRLETIGTDQAQIIFFGKPQPQFQPHPLPAIPRPPKQL